MSTHNADYVRLPFSGVNDPLTSMLDFLTPLHFVFAVA